MSRLTITQRVTLFYAAVLLILSLLIMTVFYITLDLQISQVSKASLERTVKNSFDYIEAPGDWLEVSDQFDFYVNDVSLIIYGPEGTRILGQIPTRFPDQLPLRSDVHQQISTDAENWQIYDLLMEYPNGSTIWIRGIHSLSAGLSTLQNVLRTMLIALPVLIILALLLGFLITRRAFAPIKRIQQTAEDIQRDRDLSRRINLPASHQDEIYLLGQTFDKLFERLETAFASEQQFTSDVSHELRTPISVILSQAEYGLSEDHTHETYRECLQSICTQANQMSNLVAQLLELSRSANDRQMLRKEPLNLAELCQIVIEELTEKAAEKNIRFIEKLDPGIILSLDQTQMTRAVINLVSNAINHGQQNGFIMLDLYRQAGEVHLVVADDGAGIAAEHLDKIFNRFYQVDPSRPRSQSGNTGLGLAMVRQIAESHGGRVSVQSTEGVGSAFSIILPDQPHSEANQVF